jgi:NAD-dependent deacetylase
MGNLLIFSGAGLSAESGISTFRGNNGLWGKYDVQEVANFSTWKQNKERVFEFSNVFRETLGQLSPNPAHFALAELEKELGLERCFHFTQNVDDLLERAGCKNVVHIHGSIRRMQCLNCAHHWDVGFSSVPVNICCPSCGSSEEVKPGIVMFNELAPEYENLIRTFNRAKEGDIILVIGTSGNVVPMQWIVGMLKGKSFNILVNLEEIDGVNSVFDSQVLGRAGQMLPKLVTAILSKLNEK